MKKYGSTITYSLYFGMYCCVWHPIPWCGAVGCWTSTRAHVLFYQPTSSITCCPLSWVSNEHRLKPTCVKQTDVYITCCSYSLVSNEHRLKPTCSSPNRFQHHMPSLFTSPKWAPSIVYLLFYRSIVWITCCSFSWVSNEHRIELRCSSTNRCLNHILLQFCHVYSQLPSLRRRTLSHRDAKSDFRGCADIVKWKKNHKTGRVMSYQGHLQASSARRPLIRARNCASTRNVRNCTPDPHMIFCLQYRALTPRSLAVHVVVRFAINIFRAWLTSQSWTAEKVRCQCVAIPVTHERTQTPMRVDGIPTATISMRFPYFPPSSRGYVTNASPRATLMFV